MQIKPYDGVLAPGSTSPASVRPTDVAQLAAKALLGEGDSVQLSVAVRNLASALRAALPLLELARDQQHLSGHALDIAELLTPRDRFVLVRALELVQTEGLDPKHVQNLILDLARYRVRERPVEAPEQDALGLPPAREPQGQLAALATRVAHSPRLALPAFSPNDEAVARTLLTSLALRDTALEHNFVRTLIDPDRQLSHAVDFSFLRRLVVALSPSHADGKSDPSVSLDRRSARTTLAEAIAVLDLAASELPKPSQAVMVEGRALLHERLATLIASEPSRDQKPLHLQLRANDRALLSILYVAAKAGRIEPVVVDDVARALIALRKTEQAELTIIRRALAPNAPPQEVVSGEPSLGQTKATLIPRPLMTALPQRPDSGTSPPTARVGEPGYASRAEINDELAPLPARTFGSSSQIAAKVAGTYRSLVPPAAAYAGHAPSPVGLQLEPLKGLLVSEQLQPMQATAQPPLLRPLDLSQALGLGALLNQARGLARRAGRPRLRARPDAAVHAVTAPREAGSEAEGDDPIQDGARASHDARGKQRRRVRWHLLIQRRKRSRKHKE